jgi:hypothetical protein
MDPIQISMLIGISTLIIERFFSWIQKIKHSKCKNNLEIDIEKYNM